MTQPTTTEPDLTEAMEVWREAIDAASDSSIKFKTRADQAAARAIATALEARDERIRELEGALAWYADQFCELGTSHDCCGRMTSDDCSGCMAQAILTKKEPKA